ncbi:hypothetical protein E2C01_048632 [Portunus trituberculatus]|uniref:Transmembrane protein n=1 Tax=Portunus trituberculatus TaxID=210409 RepID=A0A5B7GBH3_PORTR|nr:hypothetical protein [Portunus trituberculatus]
MVVVVVNGVEWCGVEAVVGGIVVVAVVVGVSWWWKSWSFVSDEVLLRQKVKLGKYRAWLDLENVLLRLQ